MYAISQVSNYESVINKSCKLSFINIQKKENMNKNLFCLNIITILYMYNNYRNNNK